MNYHDPVRIEAFGQVAEVTPTGAEPVSWSIKGRPMLWRPDPAVWPCVSPILFPIVGRAAGGAIRVGGRSYPMDVHGFAAGSRFELIKHSTAGARLALASSKATRELFPFAFRLEATYRLDGDGLLASFTVGNPGPDVLPYALGLHPGFRWPFAGETRQGHRIVFDEAERARVPVITTDGLFAAESRPIPLRGRVLKLDDALMSREALCFLDARSRSLRFEAPDGAAIVVEVENFRHLALWSRPPAPFLSIEAWTGHGDPDGFAGDLADKPSMTLLEAGDEARHTMRWRFEPAR
ncbi:MAG: aldose 1-epimerase family protein [Rhizobiaceae bacterium]|nr:aldose 1-epimerase family protein [Rhizobiaceae bacterium]MCV0405174.1 aldose 1-epimerase family protein [Rhizobiaceae bacterium]